MTMFKTKEQIEEMANNWAKKDLFPMSERCDDYSIAFNGRIKGFKSGYSQAQKDLLKSASEEVDEWFLNHNWKPEELMSRQASCRVAWQAAKLSSMKEIQEKDKEIERLKSLIKQESKE